MIFQGTARYPVTEIILHCADTRPGWMAERPLAEKVAEIRRWHVEQSKRCVRPVVSAFWIFGQATLQMMFAGGTLWSTKMSTGWRFPVGGAYRGSRFWMGQRVGSVGRTI